MRLCTYRGRSGERVCYCGQQFSLSLADPSVQKNVFLRGTGSRLHDVVYWGTHDSGRRWAVATGIAIRFRRIHVHVGLKNSPRVYLLHTRPQVCTVLKSPLHVSKRKVHTMIMYPPGIVKATRIDSIGEKGPKRWQTSALL